MSAASRNKRSVVFMLAIMMAMGVIVMAAITAGPAVTGVAGSPNNVVVTTPTTMDTTGGIASPLIVFGKAEYNLATAEALPADSESNTWVNTLTSASATTALLRIHYAVNPTTSATHSFSTVSGLAAFPAIDVPDFSGVKATSPFDQQSAAAASGSVATLQAGSVLPTEGNEVVVACLALGVVGTPTIDGGFSSPHGSAFVVGTNYGIWCSYLIQTSAATANPTWTLPSSTADAAAALATFKSAAGGGGATPCQRSLLGVGCDVGEHGVTDPAAQTTHAKCLDNLPFVFGIATCANKSSDRFDFHRGSMRFATGWPVHKAEDYTSNVSRFARSVRN